MYFLELQLLTRGNRSNKNKLRMEKETTEVFDLEF